MKKEGIYFIFPFNFILFLLFSSLSTSSLPPLPSLYIIFYIFLQLPHLFFHFFGVLFFFLPFLLLLVSFFFYFLVSFSLTLFPSSSLISSLSFSIFSSFLLPFSLASFSRFLSTRMYVALRISKGQIKNSEQGHSRTHTRS
jgi:hypothetical protein